MNKNNDARITRIYYVGENMGFYLEQCQETIVTDATYLR